MVTRILASSVGGDQRNLIINGAWDYWQRGTTGTFGTISEYAYMDRIQGERSGSGTVTYLRNTNVPSSVFQYSGRITHSGATNGARTWQRIEADLIRPWIGRQVCFSLWFRYTGGAPTAATTAAYTPLGGVKDTWSADNTDNVNFFTESVISQFGAVNQWKRVYSTFVVPETAAAGMVVGFLIDSAPAGTVHEQTGWMLTLGSRPPQNFYRHGSSLQAELAACQRYYEKSYDLDVAPGTITGIGIVAFTPQNGASNGNSIGGIQFKVTKRTPSPSVVLYNPVTGATGSIRYNGDNFSVSIANNGQSGCTVTNQTGGTFSADSASFAASVHYTADAEV